MFLSELHSRNECEAVMFFAAGIEKNKKDIIVSFQTILANAACK